MKRLTALFLTLVLLVGLTGCAEKTPQTVEGFTSIMEDAGFTVADRTGFVETNGVKVTVLQASNKEFVMEFYQFEKESDASQTYAGNVENAKETENRSYVSVNVGNFSKYEHTAGGVYLVIARIDNTVIFCKADKENKDTVKSLVEALGYN